MPIYEYRCKKCSNRFELRRGLAARDDAAPCPNCRSRATARIEVQRIATITGVRPDAAAGEGESEDFLDGSDDDHGHGHGHSHGPGGHTHGGVDDWGDDDGDAL